MNFFLKKIIGASNSKFQSGLYYRKSKKNVNIKQNINDYIIKH